MASGIWDELSLYNQRGFMKHFFKKICPYLFIAQIKQIWRRFSAWMSFATAGHWLTGWGSGLSVATRQSGRLGLRAPVHTGEHAVLILRARLADSASADCSKIRTLASSSISSRLESPGSSPGLQQAAGSGRSTNKNYGHTYFLWIGI